jgi:hypothetical protein
MLSHQTVQTATDEEFNALTSLTKTKFEELLKIFTIVWEDSFQMSGTPLPWQTRQARQQWREALVYYCFT